MAERVEEGPPPWWRVVLVGRHPKRTFIRILILVALCFIGREFVALPIRVEGISMLPTYKDGQVKLVNRLAYRFREPQRGDVVAIRLAGQRVMYMKRIIGLPGETVAFQEGNLIINGEVMEETYLKLPCDWNVSPVNVGPDEYYVVGDNRSMAEVDHVKGRAARDRIVGRVIL